MEGTKFEPKLVEVKIISKEMVKPSSHTPSNLETLTLSCVDQIIPISPPKLTPILLFYPALPETQPVDIPALKTALSRTLITFYPLAGRVNQSTITCNDEGLPFFEARVNCPLSDIMYTDPNPDILSKLLPKPESLGIVENQPVFELSNFSFQISVFTCGGVVLAWYDIHKITDGMSSVHFFKHWAAMASHPDDGSSLVGPNFEIGPATFPPLSNPEPLSFPNIDPDALPKECSVVVKSFLFKNSDVNKLKLKAGTNQGLNPSRLMTVSGFIWEQALASKRVPISDPNDQKTALILSMDMRTRLTPPLPEGSMGNLFTALVVSAETSTRLPDLVAEIKDAVSKKNDEIRGYNSEDNVNPMRENWGKLWETLIECKDRTYRITSLCKVGFSELDFGFGKPKWVVPIDGNVNFHSRNFIILNDYCGGKEEGIEAWLFLEEKEMEALESNPEFLAFASPVF